jgi:PHD-finger
MAESVNAEGECGVCSMVVKDTDKAFSCDVCSKWHHIKCVEVSVKQCEVIAKFEGKMAGLHWYCLQCNTIATKTLAGFRIWGNGIREDSRDTVQLKCMYTNLRSIINGVRGKS